MVFNEIAPGLQSSWGLVKKLGEGDAGEVFLVESLLERRAAILKRPHRSTFSSDIMRQAAQIETEGKILRALSGVRVVDGAGPDGVRTLTPALLDQGQPGAEFSERFFIIQEKAAGLNLNALARAVRFGVGEPGGQSDELDAIESFLITRLAQRGEVPPLILLRALSSVIDLFEKIHTARTVIDGSDKLGLVWNDVKPEHLFWDPARRRFTVIDWGNGQFLELDGATKDRRHSRLDDYSQFVQEMGKFLSSAAPDLHARLEWPGGLLLADAYPEAVKALRERISGLLYEELEGLRDARQSEEILTLSSALSSAPVIEQLPELEALHDQIIGYGELPDFAGAERFFVRLASKLAAENRLEEFRQICSRARQLPTANGEKWSLLAQLGEVAGQNSDTGTAHVGTAHAGSAHSGTAHSGTAHPGTPHTGSAHAGTGHPGTAYVGSAHAVPAHSPGAFHHALVAGSSDDWAGVLWDLVSVVHDNLPPPWFDDLISRVRRMHLGESADTLTPFVTVSRLVYTLQAALQKQVEQEEQQSLMWCLREDVVRKWNQLEPDPPDSGLDYAEIDCLMNAIQELLPEAQGALSRSLDQPKAQVSIILDAWNRKDFETARRGLRGLLLWDPDRRRVLTADRAIQAAPAWLEKIYLGPKKGEPVQDFLTYAELSGRELRNQVGSARWLDLILDAFARLRKGASPADLIAERPELLNEVFWLNDYEARRPAPVPRDKPVRLEREPNVPAAEPTTGPAALTGIKEGELAQDGELFLAESLDTWVPEARGSSARVFLGFLRTRGGQRRQAAVKVMRPDRAEYALPLFREETQILTLMRDVPGVTGLLECGYIRLDGCDGFPTDDRAASARGMCGSVARYGVGEIRDFMASLESRTGEGWLPYLAMEKREREDNLMTLCDAGFTHGRFLPVDESLRLAIQICEILQAAHSRNIVYRDHKILHYYWQEVYNGVFMIDWNVAKRHPQGLTNAERQFDLVQFGARALHHILTGRPAPGALPLGPTRPEEIEQAAHTYRVRWTYDDQRLPSDIKDILEGVLSGRYDSVKPLRDDLYGSFQRFVNHNP